MSFWLGYVVIEGGEVRMATDYHGYGFFGSVLGGPDQMLAEIAQLGSQPYWEGELDGAYEGAVLIDVDRRVLAAWTNATTHKDRHFDLDLLRWGWQDYDVRWAYGGTGDIEAHLGYQPGVGTLFLDPCWTPYQTWHMPHDESFFLVTVDDAGYALNDPYEVSSALLAGPDEAMTLPDAWRIENLAVWWRRDQPVPLPSLGLHLDTASRTVTGWTVHSVKGVAERWAQAWPGWQWAFDHDRYDRNYARCDELVRMFLPEPLYGDGWPPLR